MYENENLVAEATENAENTAEQTPPKTFTQDELNEIVGKAKARERAKITKQYERQNAEMQELVDTLRAGTGKESVGEMNSTFKEFYESKGIKINKT
jgi:FtsZ-interacting cell division protein YlmF